MPRDRHIPTVALLEATHTFPGDYTMKVIGISKGAFLARVVSVARETLKSSGDPIYHYRESASGEHVSVTLDLKVSSAAEVVSVYRGLLEVPGLVLLL